MCYSKTSIVIGNILVSVVTALPEALLESVLLVEEDGLCRKGENDERLKFYAVLDVFHISVLLCTGSRI